MYNFQQILGFGQKDPWFWQSAENSHNTRVMQNSKQQKLNTSLNDPQTDKVYNSIVAGYSNRHFRNLIPLKCPA